MDDLPIEMLSRIAFYLPISDVFDLFYKISSNSLKAFNSELLWRDLCHDEGLTLQISKYSSWKEMFKNYYFRRWDKNRTAEGLLTKDPKKFGKVEYNISKAHWRTACLSKFGIRNLNSYFEIEVEKILGGNAYKIVFGITLNQGDYLRETRMISSGYTSPFYIKKTTWSYWANGTQKLGRERIFGEPWSEGDKIGVQVNRETREISFYKSDSSNEYNRISTSKYAQELDEQMQYYDVCVSLIGETGVVLTSKVKVPSIPLVEK